MEDLSNFDLHRILGWQALAIYFLNGFNPKCERHPVILQAIVQYTDCRFHGNLRYSAHSFVQLAYEIIERDSKYLTAGEGVKLAQTEWLTKWRTEYFPL